MEVRWRRPWFQHHHQGIQRNSHKDRWSRNTKDWWVSLCVLSISLCVVFLGGTRRNWFGERLPPLHNRGAHSRLWRFEFNDHNHHRTLGCTYRDAQLDRRFFLVGSKHHTHTHGVGSTRSIFQTSRHTHTCGRFFCSGQRKYYNSKRMSSRHHPHTNGRYPYLRAIDQVLLVNE